jgi:uncharacterized membrane protein
MTPREKLKLKTWQQLRDQPNPGYLDILRYQSSLFYVVWSFLIMLGLYVLFTFGFYSTPGGVFLGAIAVSVGYLQRLKNNIAIEIKYLDWNKIDNTESD